MNQLHVTIPRALREALRKHALDQGISASELTRRALVAYLESEGIDVSVPAVKWGGLRAVSVAGKVNEPFPSVVEQSK